MGSSHGISSATQDRQAQGRACQFHYKGIPTKLLPSPVLLSPSSSNFSHHHSLFSSLTGDISVLSLPHSPC